MVVGEWRLSAAGQGRVCARTLGLLLDPGGGAVESHCAGRDEGRANQQVSHTSGSRVFSTFCKTCLVTNQHSFLL